MTSYPSPLPNPPSDGVSSLTFSSFPSPHPATLLASSWDGSLRYYAPTGPSTPTQAGYECTATCVPNPNNPTPLLHACFGPTARFAYAAGLDGVLYQCDMEKNTANAKGRHEKAISTVKSSVPNGTGGNAMEGCVVTGSWDGKVKVWDVRAPTVASSTGSVFEVDVENKVFSSDFVENKLMVCTSGRKVHLYDVRKIATGGNATTPGGFDLVSTQIRESSLKYQTRSCALMPNLEGFSLGSIEGRCAIEYMSDDAVAIAQGKKKYAFKCHRVDSTVYPVNAVAFHPNFLTFATGGCDGQVVVWDAKLKKRLVALPRLATSVSALAFSKGKDGGDLLAVAASYTFEEGEKDHPTDEIYVRKMMDFEVASR